VSPPSETVGTAPGALSGGLPVEQADVLVVGGGILGLATARALLHARPGLTVVVAERETDWAAHQSGHNSNVIHSGLYYAPGGLKARLARAGGEQMIQYCEARGVPVRRTGKLVLATHERQLPQLAKLERRGSANGVTVRRIGVAEIREREPHVQGVAGLLVAETAVTDFALVCGALAEELRQLGAVLRPGAAVVEIERRGGESIVATVGVGAAEIRAKVVVNCAGLHSDVIAKAAGVRPAVRILPFRGEYADLRRPDLINGPVYPVPDPELPFLGVHFTPMLDGTVHVGPNAVPALARHGYRWRDVDLAFLRGLAGDRSLHRLARRYWRIGAAEIVRSLVWPLFVRNARHMVPQLCKHDLSRGGSGVRAQAVADDGSLVDDFVITRVPGGVHVLNAPSPAATASLLIGERIAGDVLEELPAAVAA
jgi:malate dehydrogenase (quinone)/L-2-hydroxyglutarate oxidase